MTPKATDTKPSKRAGKQTAVRAKEGADRPPLTPEISLDDFRNHYWYMDEVVAFCRENGLSTAGRKLEVVQRIEEFLKTGRRGDAPAAARRRAATRAAPREGPITMDTPVTAAFKCDAETRDFFKSVIGDHFHFTAYLQHWRRERQAKGVPLTYGDLVREWLADQERRKDKSYRPYIERTWEYNGFVRDFMADKARNAGKGIRDAATAWNRIRVHRGPRTYAEYVRLQESGAEAAE